jgi:hypothetical protein
MGHPAYESPAEILSDAKELLMDVILSERGPQRRPVVPLLGWSSEGSAFLAPQKQKRILRSRWSLSMTLQKVIARTYGTAC